MLYEATLRFQKIEEIIDGPERVKRKRTTVIRLRGEESNLPHFYISQEKLVQAVGNKAAAREFASQGSQLRLRCAWFPGECDKLDGGRYEKPVNIAVPRAGGPDEPIVRPAA